MEDIGKRHRVSLVLGCWVGKIQVRETCERLTARVRDMEIETEIQSHRDGHGQRERVGDRESTPWLPRDSAQSCTLTHPHPSLLFLVATVTGRLNMQQRRLGLQTWPVSMETGQRGSHLC